MPNRRGGKHTIYMYMAAVCAGADTADVSSTRWTRAGRGAAQQLFYHMFVPFSLLLLFHFIITKIWSPFILCLKKIFLMPDAARRFPVLLFGERVPVAWVENSSLIFSSFGPVSLGKNWKERGIVLISCLFTPVLHWRPRDEYEISELVVSPSSTKMIVSCKCLNIEVETKDEPVNFDKRLLGAGYNTRLFSKVDILLDQFFFKKIFGIFIKSAIKIFFF